jgi:hypothetical protein
VDQLAKQAAELALRLAALPAAGSRTHVEALDAIEQLAMRVLQEVSASRVCGNRPVGETRGMWPVMRPTTRH